MMVINGSIFISGKQQGLRWMSPLKSLKHHKNKCLQLKNKKLQQTPKGTYPRPSTTVPVYVWEIPSYLYFGVTLGSVPFGICCNFLGYNHFQTLKVIQSRRKSATSSQGILVGCPGPTQLNVRNRPANRIIWSWNYFRYSNTLGIKWCPGSISAFNSKLFTFYLW